MDEFGEPVLNDSLEVITKNRITLSPELDSANNPVLLEDYIPVPYVDVLNKTLLVDSEGLDLYSITTTALPREFFTYEAKTLNINPKGDNIISKRNVFSRLKSLEFSS